MRLHFDFSEYEEDDDGTRVLLTVTLPDGQSHQRVTEIYEKAVSLLYGYDIGGGQQYEFNFDGDNKEVTKDTKECFNCVQGTCVFNCGREFP